MSVSLLVKSKIVVLYVRSTPLYYIIIIIIIIMMYI